MKTGRKNNNSGFSLVELVIVIAIMAVLVGVMATSITSLTGRRVRKCADEIVTTLERTRVLTLGKEQNQVECVISYNDTTRNIRHRSGREMWRYPTGYWEKNLLISRYILKEIPRDIPDGTERIRQPVTLCFIFKGAASGV